VVGEYGTTITVEALMRDWLPAFWQHRTISLQHNLPQLCGLRGKPYVGRATGVDFAPQLEVEVEVLDPETRRLIEEGRITGACLEAGIFFASKKPALPVLSPTPRTLN